MLKNYKHNNNNMSQQNETNKERPKLKAKGLRFSGTEFHFAPTGSTQNIPIANPTSNLNVTNTVTTQNTEKSSQDISEVAPKIEEKPVEEKAPSK